MPHVVSCLVLSSFYVSCERTEKQFFAHVFKNFFLLLFERENLKWNDEWLYTLTSHDDDNKIETCKKGMGRKRANNEQVKKIQADTEIKEEDRDSSEEILYKNLLFVSFSRYFIHSLVYWPFIQFFLSLMLFF